MDGGAPGTIVAFALGALPGVVVLELLEFGRPRFRDRKGTRALGQFLLLSLVAWAFAVLVFGAGDDLAKALDAQTGSSEIRAYEQLSWHLLASAVAVGVILRILNGVILGFARWFERQSRAQPGTAVVGRMAVGFASLASAWDQLLSRLQREGAPQLVHVRFKDGSDAYGLMAGEARADFQADGRGLVLAAEFVPDGDNLVRLDGSSGIFIAPAAVASVSFIRYPEDAGAGR